MGFCHRLRSAATQKITLHMLGCAKIYNETACNCLAVQHIVSYIVCFSVTEAYRFVILCFIVFRNFAL